MNSVHPFDEVPRLSPRRSGMDDLSYLSEISTLGPVVRNSLGFLNTFSSENLHAVLTSSAFRHIELDLLRYYGISEGAVSHLVANSLVFANNPEHRRRRLPIARAVAQTATADLRRAARQEAREQANHLRGQTDVDFLDWFVDPFLYGIVSRLLGFKGKEKAEFCHHLSSVPLTTLFSPEQIRNNEYYMREMMSWVSASLDEWCCSSNDGLIGSFLETCQQGELTTDEIVAQIVSVLIASFDTTRLALAMTIALLLTHTAQWQMLRLEPEKLAPKAIAESLRFAPVVGSAVRISTQTVVLSGYEIPAETVVTPFFVSALRDPAVYEAPNVYNILRKDIPRHHPGFGAGPHRCVGAALAEPILQEAIIALAFHCGDIKLSSQPPRLRGLDTVRVMDQMRVSV